MKIIKPSATIIEDELSKLSIYQRIDACASVCYQRPPKPTEEEAQEFCRKMLEKKHFVPLEMAVVHLVVDSQQAECLDAAKYISVSSWEVSKGLYAASGSIRAWMESGEGSGVHSFLAVEYPLFFEKQIMGGWSNLRLADQHEIPWQHKHVAARFIVNRAVSHELVRHRPCTFLQESQRYCRYDDDVVFIEPEWITKSEAHKRISDVWKSQVRSCEGSYNELMRNGLKPQQARAVLPNSTKTELICYASLPQWKHMFDLRCSPAADPEMRRVMTPLRDEFKEKYKEVEW